jgi:ABC-type polysaccharide/polyol phosphate transport system ATPase subunit
LGGRFRAPPMGAGGGDLRRGCRASRRRLKTLPATDCTTFYLASSLTSAVVDFFLARKLKELVPAFQVFRDITFSAPDGLAPGIIGRHGAGKSILLKLLKGIYRPDKPVLGHIDRVGTTSESISDIFSWKPGLSKASSPIDSAHAEACPQKRVPTV